MRTGFAFPILVGETCTRVMSFFTCEDLALDQPLLAMLAAVGQEIGHFLQRIRAEEQLKARVRQQAAVAELGQAALAGSVLPDLMDRATRLVAETLDVELCKILELLPGGRELLLKGGVEWGSRQVGRRKVSAARRSQAGYTLSVAEPVIVRDLRTETRFSAPPLLREQGAVSRVSVIIAGEEERTPYGVLAAHTRHQREFTVDDAQFLQSVANVLASAIQRHRAEVAQREGERQLRRVLDKLFAFVGVLTPEGVVIETNRAPLEAAGITLADVSGGQFEACYTAEAFLAAYQPRGLECLLVDVSMPGMNGLQLQQVLNVRGVAVPVIVITGRQEVPVAVQAMRAGAVDFLGEARIGREAYRRGPRSRAAWRG